MTPKWRKRKKVEEEEKRCERLTSMRKIIGERRPYDRYDVRSRDCDILSTHAMDEREQESWHLKGETERRWRRKTKGVKGSHQ